ncbi:MAG: hypothetical protein OEU25_16600, partial [Rhodospirillales bacterium]|nr:hypothetical protein [Rhodospirillales bacterium]
MTIRFSCVVDEAAKFHQQAVVFVASAIVLAGISPDQIYVHVIGGRETSATRHLRGLGVTIVPCRPFDPAHPYCNKLLQLRSAPLQDADLLVLCDCDLAFAGPIGDALEGMRLRAKIVDCANPPLSILEGLFRSADFPGPLRTRKVDFSDD